jgi:hypothetical protein
LLHSRIGLRNGFLIERAEFPETAPANHGNRCDYETDASEHELVFEGQLNFHGFLSSSSIAGRKADPWNKVLMPLILEIGKTARALGRELEILISSGFWRPEITANCCITMAC